MPLGWPPATLVRLPLGATCWSHRHWLRMLRRSGARLPLQLRPPYQACATLMGLPLRWALGLQQQRRQALARALFYGLHFKPNGRRLGLHYALLGPSTGFGSSSGGRVATSNRSLAAWTFCSNNSSPSCGSSSLQHDPSL
jgi:hypothetical protein